MKGETRSTSGGEQRSAPNGTLCPATAIDRPATPMPEAKCRRS